MASDNGGVVGVTNVPTPRPELVTPITSTNPGFAVRAGNDTVDLLLVGGGGSGLASIGTAGGAGGFLLTPAHPVPSSPFPVTIGAGGSGPSSGNDTVFGAASPLTAGQGGQGGTTVPLGSGGGTASGGPQGNPGGPSGPFRGGGGGKGGGGFGPPNRGRGGDGSPASPLFGAGPQPYYPSFADVFAGGGTGGGQYGSNNSFAFVAPGGGGHGAPNEGGGQGGAGGTATGAGGGGNGSFGGGPGGNGGGGIVLVKQPALPTSAPGVWSLQGQFQYKKSGNWT